MKKYFAIFGIAAAVLVASCTREQLAPESPVFPAGKTVITLTTEMTKTTMGELSEGKRPVYWANGDKIAVNGVVSDPLADLDPNSASASFTIPSVLEAPFKAVYPETIWKDELSVALPQEAKSGILPLAGYGDSESLAVKPLTAAVKLSIKKFSGENPDLDKIVKVSIISEDAQLSGNFGIDFETGVLTPYLDPVEDDRMVCVRPNLTLTETAEDLFIPVPAGTYSFKVKIVDNQGHFMEIPTTSAKSFAAGDIKAFPEIEFVPTGTEFDVVITSAEELIQFAEDWNSKKWESVVARLANDITFDATTSAAFNATGGIGLKKFAGDAEDFYFNGTLDGGNHIISGLVATVPLFVAVDTDGVVKDLTIDGSCSFAFTHIITSELDAGAVVGYHKGLLENVKVESDVSLDAVSEIVNETCFGGIVGRETVGTIKNCEYSGSITVPSGFQSSAKKIYVGGVVGRISNVNGKVLDTGFKGTIDNEGQMIASEESDDMKNNPQLIIGGIAGLNSGTIDNCASYNHSTGITVTLTDSSGDHNYTGTIVTHSVNAYHYAIAGIAGRNDGAVSNCVNNAYILDIFSAERGNGGNMNGRYLNVGGIVGFNGSSAEVMECINNGSIINRANPKVQYVGGVVGRNFGYVASCNNESTGSIAVGTSHKSPYGARIPYFGGVIGHNASSGTVGDINNAANITVSRIESVSGVMVHIGGVIGRTDASVDGSLLGGTITNSGVITQSNGNIKCSAPTVDNDYGLFLGGIVGYATFGVKNVSNSGNLTYTCTNAGKEAEGETPAVPGGVHYVHLGGIVGKVKATSTVDVDACSNTANVQFTASATNKASSLVVYDYNYLGGIAGYAENAAFKGNCINFGQIKGGDNSQNKNTANTFWVGGIVGYLTGESSVNSCTHSGIAYNDHWSNRATGPLDSPMSGGIAGQIVGTADNHITIQNCSTVSGANVTGRRGVVGGIVGAATYAEISSCSVAINLTGGSAYTYGGIVAQTNNTSINGCTYSGSTISSSQLKAAEAYATGGGGIVGRLNAGSSVSDCISNVSAITNDKGEAITFFGGIAGASASGSSISGSHYKSTIQICSDNKFTGSGNVADL